MSTEADRQLDPEGLRNFLYDELCRELFGPRPGLPAQQLDTEEILRAQDPPRIRYSCGVLFPLASAVADQEDAAEAEVADADLVEYSDEELEGAEVKASTPGASPVDDDETTDQSVALANEYLPSAMGISALVAVDGDLIVTIGAATYDRVEVTGAAWSYQDQTVSHWRTPISAKVVIPRDELLGNDTVIVRKPVSANGSETGLELHVISRPHRSRDADLRAEVRLVTFSLINRLEASTSRPRDQECFFQCELSVTGVSEAPIFLEYPTRPGEPLDEEEASLQLLYRHRKVFAVGHGCAADWETPGSERQTATTWIRTSTIPSYEVRPVVPASIEGVDLSMRTLSDPHGEEALQTCRALSAAYREWIQDQRHKIDSEVPPGLHEAAGNHMSNCDRCLERIDDGITLLENQPVARRAFALMNRAILMQQIHYRLSSEHIREWHSREGRLELTDDFTQPDYEHPSTWGIKNPDEVGKWRPFQLAFILMNLRSLVEPNHPDRRIVDLIWFPTGGGKTEAYLGLAAFAILLRRTTRPNNAGTAVLMRYTLRLLTAQQYQRAASLICALEFLRRKALREEEDLPFAGNQPISIGLWVGSALTPNSEQQALTGFRKLLEGDRQNPFVVLSCPWCGARMGPVEHGRHQEVKGYRRLSRPQRIRFICEDDACEFSGSEGLPLHVIDEAMYAQPPTLVIGTVDKFALLPWKPKSRAFFGLDDEATDPPELIIQDELHLISGPLGSMVGHYETVIDLLCSTDEERGGHSAKIVASTATISRAPDQVKALYGSRGAFLFPPQGLRAGSSFFAREDERRPGRLYVGVFASALPSHVTAQIRLLSTLLQGIKNAPVASESDRDPYWTLMAYFNSLRELGHAATLIRADIREYLNAMWDRLGLTKALGGDEAAAKRRFINNASELTSRIHSSRIPESMQELFVPYGKDGIRPVDICLATNMIQVGLDVPRLSLMAVVGQPKTTSEYIQATSRVGRSYPGLVVTIYNAGRPRDRSHYEHFRSYHESLYRHVEPTSVTPFSIPVRDRALHALLVTLVRFWGNDTERQYPDPVPRQELFSRIREALLHRVEEVDPSERDQTAEHFDHLVEEWIRVPPARYGDFAPPTVEVPLMHPSGSQQLPDWLQRSWPTPTSMRNVDSECNAQTVARYTYEDN